MRLFIEEVKRVLKFPVFLAVSAALIFSVFTQSGDSYIVSKPEDKNGEYGFVLKDDIEIIIPRLMDDLNESIEKNSFSTYPYGFYREKTLSEEELSALKNLIPLIRNNYKVEEQLENNLAKADGILGGGSFFSPRLYKYYYGSVKKDFNEALMDYNLMKESGFDTVFARYFCDYSGLFSLILSWLIGIFFWNKDNGKGISGTIFQKNFSSLKLVLSRTLALTLSVLFSLILLFTFYEIKMHLLYNPSELNPLTAYLTVILWLMPGILIIMSLSALIYIISGGIIAGFLGPVLTLLGIVSFSSGNIVHNISRSLLLRFNSIGNEAYFRSVKGIFISGRLLWMTIGVLLIIFTSFLYEIKRRGGYGNKDFKIRDKA